MAVFELAKVIRTVSGADVKITAYLGSGKRHDVYSVDYNNQTKILVWYKDGIIRETKESLRVILESHIKMKNPNDAFLWPIEMVVDGEDFGYIVDLRSSEYRSASEILEFEGKFISEKDIVDACMKVANAFNALSEQGLGYQDLNLKNIYINSEGEVLINYLDNVLPIGAVPTCGSLKFTAPELCKRETNRISEGTVVYAFSVLVFMLLFRHHPLEGARWLVPFLTDDVNRDIYIDNPVFIFDENNDSNAPSPYVQKRVTEVWRSMPLYAQNFFKDVFSKDSFIDDTNRASLKEWLIFLARLRNDIVKCNCGNEVIIKNNSSADCKKCGHAVNVEFVLALSDFRIAIHKGTRVYKCLLGKLDSREAAETALVVAPRADAPNVFGIKNVTDDVVNAITPSGSEKAVERQSLIPIMDGIALNVYDTTINIKKKT